MKRRRFGTYGTGKTTPIFDELRRSEAYRILSQTQRLILLDMLRVYCRASCWDTERVPEGFRFTYEQCEERISETGFYQVMRRLLKVGFLSAPPEIQEGRPAAPRRYLPCEDWRSYEPTADERRRLRGFENARKARLKKKKHRRANYWTNTSPNEDARQVPNWIGGKCTEEVGENAPA